jgi:ubiquinone/menaquinone biosynthesis C-methylase UbiE
MVNLSAGEGFLDVDHVVSSLGIKPGQHVADFGCGSGFFTVALSNAVGKDGMVTAVDVMEEPLQSVLARTEGLGFKNVKTVRADLEVLGSTKLHDDSQDLILLKNILFQSKKKEAVIAEAGRTIKPGGQVVIIDWVKGQGGFGPPQDLRTDSAEVESMAKACGLRLDHQLHLDSHHFGLVFTK